MMAKRPSRRDPVELMAIACCWAEFLATDASGPDPIAYWGKVAEANKAHYRRQGAALVALVRSYPQVRR